MTASALRVRGLRVEFGVGSRSLFGRQNVLSAVDDIDLDIAEHQTLGLVGESGSGKSTTARAILRLVEPTGGTVEIAGTDLASLPRRELRRARRHVQMVFQDPYSSLDPAMVVADIVGEPLDVHESLSRDERDRRVAEALTQVGLASHHLERYPYEFSGGQRQRIAIARSIVLQPHLVVLDEPVSALDASTQSQIINLLSRLQRETGVSYLFIAHDLAVVRHVSDEIAVMYLGRIVERGPAERVYTAPAHPYTAALLSAIPDPNPVRQRERRRVVATGDVPSALDPPPGCRFHTRCPFAMDICRHERPEMTPVDGGGEVACHLQTSGPTLAGEPLGDLRATDPRVGDGVGSAT